MPMPTALRNALDTVYDGFQAEVAAGREPQFYGRYQIGGRTWKVGIVRLPPRPGYPNVRYKLIAEER